MKKKSPGPDGFTREPFKGLNFYTLFLNVEEEEYFPMFMK